MSEAYNIANRNENLKTDFVRNTERKNITFLGFDEKDIEVVDLNDKKYFQIQILKGDISWVKDNTYYDGWLCEDDLDLLRCLVDVNTGE